MKVLVEGGDALITAMFEARGHEVINQVPEDDWVNLVCFRGGADVTPELYGEAREQWTGSDLHTDVKSLALYIWAKARYIPMVGICRGGQFLNVMAGGKMIQHYGGHAIRGTHAVELDGDIQQHNPRGKYVEVTSTHHQVIQPREHGQDILGWVQEGDVKVAEIVHNWGDGTLSFQPHPEYLPPDHPCQELFFALLDDLFVLDV